MGRETGVRVGKMKKGSFAKGNNFYKLFWIFLIGCIVGVIIEVIWCFARYGRIESRQGLVYGPFNLVYGVGALIMTLAMSPLRKKNPVWIILAGALIGGIFEYLCSYIQEYFTGTISWDYTGHYFNLNGRVSLLYSLFWGILALFWCKLACPKLSLLIEKIPNKIGIILTWVLFAFMILNTVVSATAVYRMHERKKNVPPKNSVEVFFDNRFDDERMGRIYPNMMLK